MSAVTIVIPSHNEELRIRQTLLSYLRFFPPHSVCFIVVLNDCHDQTEHISETISKQFPGRIRLVVIPERGKGRAILAGFRLADSGIVGFLDADGSTAPEEFEKLLLAISTADCAIASRVINGSRVIGRTRFRTSASWIFRLLVRLLFHLPVQDTQCGAKVFRSNVLAPILPKIQTTDWTFDVEILARLHLEGRTIREVPTQWIERKNSVLPKSKIRFLQTSLILILSLFKIKFIVHTHGEHT